jgi:hypothetical protein
LVKQAVPLDEGPPSVLGRNGFLSRFAERHRRRQSAMQAPCDK